MANEADTRQDGRPSIAGFMVAPKSGGNTMNSSLSEQVRHLYEVEGLSIRQITSTLAISRKKVSRIINNEAKPPIPASFNPMNGSSRCGTKLIPL
jgi:hypothetical protein